MPKQVDIFISSKMGELRDEREALYRLLPELGQGMINFHAWVFEEDAPASDRTIREVYLAALEKSALYIGLFWNEYGEYTVDEFERATEWGIPRHIYVKDVDTDKRDPRLHDFLQRNQQVVAGTTHKWFKTIDSLRAAVQKSLETWVEERLTYRPGSMSAIITANADDIPERPRQFVGREGLQNRINTLLHDGGRVLLQGFAGMGKTSLAAMAASNWISAGSGPVLWMKAGSEKAESLFLALARPFDRQQAVAAAVGDAKRQALRQALADSGATLLVLDDVWDGEALNDVLRAVPEAMRVLVTARQNYPLDGELVQVGRLLPQEALDLLRAYARDPFEGDPHALELCQMLGYHALALQIAGKVLRAEPDPQGKPLRPAILIQRIAGAPHRLEVPLAMAEEGHRSVADLLEVSLLALDETARRVFLTMGAFFVPQCTPGLLSLYLSGQQAGAPTDVQGALTRLQQHGLVDRYTHPDGVVVYYRLHDLAFSYAQANVENRDAGRILEACRLFAEQEREHFHLLDVEVDNLLGASGAALAAEQFDVLIDVLAQLVIHGSYFEARGHTPVSLDLLKAAADAAAKINRTREAHYFKAKLANYYLNFSGDLQTALRFYQESLDLASAMGDTEREAIVLNAIGYTRFSQGADDADSYLERAYQLATTHNHILALSKVLETRGLYHALVKQDFETARGFFEQLLRVSEQLGSDERLYFARLNLAGAESKLGHMEAAAESYRQALALAEKQDNRVRVALCLQGLGEVADALGRRDEAQTSFDQAARIFYENRAQVYLEALIGMMETGGYIVRPEHRISGTTGASAAGKSG